MSKSWVAKQPVAAKSINVRTDLLHAVAKWAHGDASRAIGAVAFRDNEIVATDGHRLVIVPCETNGHAFGVYRSHLLAAVAAQNSLARDGIDPRVGHDIVEVEDHMVGPYLTVADGPFGDRVVDLWPVDGHVQIDLGAVRVIASKIDISQYPDVRSVLKHGDDSSTPDGYLLDARFLAAIEEVNTAHANYQSGVRVVKWGRLIGGVRDPLVLKSETGVTFVVMPQRDKADL